MLTIHTYKEINTKIALNNIYAKAGPDLNYSSLSFVLADGIDSTWTRSKLSASNKHFKLFILLHEWIPTVPVSK